MNLSEELVKLQCPINWGLPEESIAISTARKKVEYKLAHEVGEEDDESSTWQKVCQCLIISVLEYKNQDNDLKVMGSHLKKIEDILKEDKGDILMKKHLPSIQYVTKAMQAHYYYKLDDEEKVKECLSRLRPFDELSTDDQAACYALRSCCFMEFAMEALESINKALELDPEDPEWNFLKGKCLARTRRYQSLLNPTLEELQALGKAARSGLCSPYHLVFCAQSLLEHAQDCFYIKRDPETARAYHTKCAEMFRRAAAKGENNGVVLVRTAKGLMHMWGYNIEDLLEHSLFRALELLPTSGFVNAVVGEWYYIRDKNIDKAIPYLRTASREHKIMSSYRYLLNILFMHKSDEELHEEMEGFWENFRDHPAERKKALKPMAGYFFFVRNDLLSAIYYWKEWLERTHQEKENVNDKTRLFLFCRDQTVALVGEVNTWLNDPRKNLCSDEEDELRSFLNVVRELRPHIDIDKVRTPRDDTIRDCVYKATRDQKAKNILIAKYKLKPANSGYKSGYNGGHWRN